MNILSMEIRANFKGEATERFGNNVAYVYRNDSLPLSQRETQYFLNGLQVTRERLATALFNR